VAGAISLLNRLADPTSSLTARPLEKGGPREKAFQRIYDAVDELGPPPSLSETEAFRELCLSTQYGDAVAGLVALNPSLLSLSEAGSTPIPVEDLLGPGGKTLVEKFFQDCVRSKQAAEESKAAAGFSKPYNDPILRGRKVYSALVLRLYSCGIVDLSEGLQVHATAGLFAVSKESGKQRFIVDAREGNSGPPILVLCRGS